eukprot:m.193053 g.193053  ORF g.193053 m.193053 type:complete len:131 (+) comp39476_c0_seq10:1216-1608(+)
MRNPPAPSHAFFSLPPCSHLENGLPCTKVDFENKTNSEVRLWAAFSSALVIIVVAALASFIVYKRAKQKRLRLSNRRTRQTKNDRSSPANEELSNQIPMALRRPSLWDNHLKRKLCKSVLLLIDLSIKSY